MTKRAVIVGGGVAGLSVAHRLRRAIGTDGNLAITVAEAQPRLGGSIATEKLDGFVVEGGADSFLTTKPWAVELVRELGLAGRLQGLRQRRVYGLHRGRLEPLPEGLVLLASPRLRSMLRGRLLSPRGKIRAAMDLFLPARKTAGDESLASFVRHRLGQEVLERIADPLVAGIHAGDPERLSVESLLPQFHAYEREWGSVIRGLRASGPSRASNDPFVPRPFATFPGGMGELTEALLQQTPSVEWRTNLRVLGIERAGDDRLEVVLAGGSALLADAVFLATPPLVSAELVGALDGRLAAALRTIPCASSVAISLSFSVDACRPLDGSGFVVPRSEGLRLKACTWASSKFDSRAPPGHVLLRAFYGGARDERVMGLSDDALTDLALDELRPILDLRGSPRFVRVHRWPHAHPQYEVGHADRVVAIESACAATPGLFLAGSAYHGIGIPDCIRDADRAARAALTFLRSKRDVAREVIA